MPFRQRDLLLVPVPFSDLTHRKVRPVVVLSNDAYNREGPDVLVAAITSNMAPRPYTLPLDTPQLEEGTMRRPSLIRSDKLFSIDQSIVFGRFGRVHVETLVRIGEEIRALLAAGM
ncbi:MAG: type II toxin-antitoxin system PemK/MazF family toxin [Planctomycetes bacterium]|nr:type II toxin-antitoxin system PemK/MazF family toxin [Planctomycetota bacterium]